MHYDRINFLKTGIMHADLLTTVSPTHAREILEPAYGMGLDGCRQCQRCFNGLLVGRALGLVLADTICHFGIAGVGGDDDFDRQTTRQCQLFGIAAFTTAGATENQLAGRQVVHRGKSWRERLRLGASG